MRKSWLRRKEVIWGIATLCMAVVASASLLQAAAQPPAGDQWGADSGSGAQWMVVELDLASNRLADSFVVMWSPESDEFLVPLASLSHLLEFPIAVDLDDLRAKGWFLDRKRDVEIDFRQGRGEVDGQVVEIGQDQWIAEPDDIYVSSGTVEEWFPIRFSFELRRLRIEIEALESLPVHRRLLRERRLARLNPLEVRQGPMYDVVEAPYRLAGVPVHDLRLQVALPTSGESTNQGSQSRAISYRNSYQVRGAGDLLWMTGRWSVSGGERSPIGSARFRLERRDPGAGLLGPLEATSVAVGDIQSSSIPVVGRAHGGRGVDVSTFPVERPDHFDRTSIDGDMAPGWEVELYRNGTFVDVTDTDSKGRYYFADIPLVFGWNELKLVFFGPYGEERVEYRNYLIGSAMIQPGQGYGRLSVQQQDRDLFSFLGDQTQRPQSGRLRATAHYEYGLSKYVSVGSRLTTLALRDGDQRAYAATGVQATWGRIFVGTEAVVDIGNGVGAQAQLHTRVGGVNIVGEHEYAFGGFAGEQLGESSSSRVGRTRLRLNGRLPWVSSVPYSLRLQREYLASGDSDSRLRGQYSFRMWRLRINNRHSLRRSPDSSYGFDGRTSARLRWNRFSPRVDVHYAVIPQRQLRHIAAVVDWRPTRTLKTSGGVYIDPRDSESLEIKGGLSGRRDGWGWGVEAGWGQKMGLSAGLSLRMGVGKNPHTDRWEMMASDQVNMGSVVPRAFWDHNDSGRFDEGDEPIEGARLVVDESRGRRDSTDEDGRFHLGGLRANRYTDLRLDPESVDDPFAVPAIDGWSVVARPGAATYVDFPVVMAGEIDGTVYRQSPTSRKQMAGACVQISVQGQEEVTRQVSAAYDGFYYFPTVPPGRYRVELCPEALEARGLLADSGHQVEIKGDGTVAADIDLNVFSSAP